MHRALSWLKRAEQLEAQDDVDGEFIFLWIAFNAAYATEIDEKYRESEQQTFRGFLQKLDGSRFREEAVRAPLLGGVSAEHPGAARQQVRVR